MPVLLEGVVRMPVAYEPWYIYKVSLIGSPASFEFMDVLFPDGSGDWDRNITNDDVLDQGFAFALEKFVTGMTEVQVAVPGSAIPFIAGGVILPTGLVKFKFAGGVQSVIECLAVDFALAKSMGRLRNHHEDHELLRITADGDVVIILTGCM